MMILLCLNYNLRHSNNLNPNNHLSSIIQGSIILLFSGKMGKIYILSIIVT